MISFLKSFRSQSGRTRRRVAPLVRNILDRGKASQRSGTKTRWFDTICLKRVSLALLTAVILSVVLCVQFVPNQVSLKFGDIAPRAILAQRTIRYEDTAATAMLRADARNNVVPQYEQIPTATAQARDSVLNAFAAIEEVAFSQPDVSPTAIVSLPGSDDESVRLASIQIRRQADIVLSERSVRTLLSMDASARRRAAQQAIALVEKGMSRPIRDSGDELVRERSEILRQQMATSDAGKALNARDEAIAELASAAIRPNLRLDARRTEADRLAAQQRVPAQIERLMAGMTVIREGERVKQRHLDAFAALGLQSQRPDPLVTLAIVCLVAMAVAFVVGYIRAFHPDIYKETPLLLLLALLSVFSVLGLKLGIAFLGIPQGGAHQLGYLGMMCVASAGMIAALLVSPAIATLMVALLSVVAGLVVNTEPRFTMITLGSSLVGILAVSSMRNRHDLVRAVLLVCGANAAMNVLVGLLEGDTTSELLSTIGWGIISGGFALMLFWVGATVFERMFGIATHLRLLELSDPATPILVEFRLCAPGTYAHSIMVANLAHTAAEAIGADALLCRVAAYYHDLGKMNRPQFFVENQSNAENIHDRLTPSLSALILTAHVKDSVAIAETVGLPRKVREVIGQHHGTTLMRFFYHRAASNLREADRVGAKNLEMQFRYPGPKPQTREAAILMLADTVEAASRTLERPTPARIREFVARLIDDKRADGQLDECDVTLRDLQTIENVFVRTLSGTLHGRIEYPSDLKTVAHSEDDSQTNVVGMALAPARMRVSANRPTEDASVGSPSASSTLVAGTDAAGQSPTLLSAEELGLSSAEIPILWHGGSAPPGPPSDLPNGLETFTEPLYGDRGERDARSERSRMGVKVRRRIPKISRRRRSS